MKLLLDQNISFKPKLSLKAHFPFISHVTDFNLQGKCDTELWDFAKAQAYSIVTFDMDFYNLSILRGILQRSSGCEQAIFLPNTSDLLLSKHPEIKAFLSEPEFDEVSCLQILK